MDILGVDPGPEKSAWVILCDGEIDTIGDDMESMGEEDNAAMLDTIHLSKRRIVAYETAFVGRRGGRAIGQTVKFTGALEDRAKQAGHVVMAIPRGAVLRHFKAVKIYNDRGDRMGNDAALRLRLIERLGKDAVPKSSHLRSAYAVALYVWDTQRMEVTS